MCGIVGYLGNKQAYPVLMEGLQMLEYRGYDSAGVALLDADNLNLYKKKGKVAELGKFVAGKNTNGTIGIGHSRWATHGEPSDRNAHPHTTPNNNLSLVHNGIIENYAVLKTELQSRGHVFASDTDTEVLLHLIEEIQVEGNYDLETAVRLALKKVEGAYAIVVMSKNDPEKLVAARKSSPLVIGLKENEFFIASDATPLVRHTKNVLYLNDEEIAVVRSNGELAIRTVENVPVDPFIQELDMKLESLTKGDFDHYMLKEIHDQPVAIGNCLRGRINAQQGFLGMSGITDNEAVFRKANRIILLGCGTSWHAALVGEYLLEDFAEIPVEVEYASEFRYRKPLVGPGDIIVAVSQSGETADTLAAMRIAKAKGAFLFSICNVAGSSISRLSDAGVYTHAGPEVGVASTKAFTTQVTVFCLMALQLGRLRGKISATRLNKLLHELEGLPQLMRQSIQSNAAAESIADLFKDSSNFLYLGRGLNFPIALEGALKLKEISYIHAEGYPAAEMKHGPIALIDEHMPVVVLANSENAYEKVVSNMQEIKARKGQVIAVVSAGDTVIPAIADFVIEVPESPAWLAPLVASVPLQLLSYHIAEMRGCEVDQPRNLAKSVTVE